MHIPPAVRQIATKMWSSPVALFLLLINVMSNLAAELWGHNEGSVLLIPALSALTSTIEFGIYLLLSKIRLHHAFLVIVVAWHLLLGIVDGYLALTFHCIIGRDIFRIIAETTPQEARAFFSVYVTAPVLGAAIATAIAATLTALLLAKVLSKRGVATMCYGMLAVGGAAACIYSGYHYLIYRDGSGIPQLQATTRFIHGLGEFNALHRQIASLRAANATVTATSTTSHPATVVVIIGESYSAFHSQLYGYDKETTPCLAKRADQGQLIVYSDAATLYDRTEATMRSIFTLNSSMGSQSQSPLFPVCFKAAGYHTSMLDNQYFVIDNGISVLNDKTLSEMMFDERNGRRFGYDANMLRSITHGHGPQLYVIHLYGQHFDYKDRYPQEFEHFHSDDYPGMNAEQGTITAQYDNATRYNDYVVDRIIGMFEGQNCVIVYLSDHGEELFELSNFRGHSTAAYSANPIYQLKVPFMVWMSEQFEHIHPEKARLIRKAVNRPILTDELPHFLMDVAEIQTSHYRPEKSFINEHYDSVKPRVVMHSIDYNSLTPPSR